MRKLKGSPLELPKEYLRELHEECCDIDPELLKRVLKDYKPSKKAVIFFGTGGELKDFNIKDWNK